ncbi:Protease inhibitor, SSI family (subtilisin inhibitor) [Actinokineospora spheciospongiae]|uniref:Protease inhibitor, SSI family (Subtilisin inhibitor) n=1 Tax=Actinokineospora spheciospongiae TaxID=909613 RepID=W7IUS1_9PSEU|nr:SSI family serine proteinase inhibitor [Actinokineospora spheciospongiae]EWC60502.1 Protease inhibitor, SSI family (subtilisin inhibitor) [Actinokineospora spheciospongiae]PWW57049.1 subtilisin inhibitor-like [Actinokineospora spheciospongiae]
MFSITLTALVAALAAAAPTPGPAPEAPQTRIALSVTDAGGRTTTAELRCGPTGGNHPAANAACAALTQVEGDLSALQVNTAQACTLEYAPVQASAAGHWRGRPITFDRAFPNACALVGSTGPVFALTPDPMVPQSEVDGAFTAI